MKVRVASAGTGKTTNLVLRYLELIAAGTPMRRIAGATFTRSAAHELRQRVAAGLATVLESGCYLDLFELRSEDRPLFEEAARELGGASLSTINGLLAGFLRLTAPQMGLDPEFVLIGEDDAAALFEDEFRSLLALQDVKDVKQNLELAQQLFGKRSLVDGFVASDMESSRLLDMYGAAFSRYRARLAGRRLAPAEVEERALQLLHTPRALERIRDRYQYLLIDEFQDVNPLQGRFFESLERQSGLAVEVVGDPKQSIYAFRDADVEVFRRALASGERLEPLRHSRRHATRITGFLNHLTSTLAAAGRGFTQDEAPSVVSAGPQAQIEGSVEVHWVTGSETLDTLRRQEARLLARRLEQFHREQSIPWSAMAVLSKGHRSLDIVHAALLHAGIPAVVARGKGFFERPEIRDLGNALRTGISAQGVAFGAWLRSPFAQLDMEQTQAVLLAEDPVAELTGIDPRVAESLQRLRQIVLEPPLTALKCLLREKLARGRRFVDYLTGRQRANVDAFLLNLSRNDGMDMELLLDELKRNAGSETAEVPQSGEGVKLMTIHASKGLEWPLVAMFDVSRGSWKPPVQLLVTPGSGVVALGSSGAAFKEADRILGKRDAQEAYRQFYVAASRPRDHLLITGSVKDGKRQGWCPLLSTLRLGPGGTGARPAGVSVFEHPSDPELAGRLDEMRAPVPALDEADWSRRDFVPGRFSPMESPSSLRGFQSTGEEPEAAGEPLAAGGEWRDDDAVPTRGAAVGTLVHQAIAFDWDPDDPAQRANLLAQEVMFPFDPAEQEEVVDEVLGLLRNYRGMLGGDLPDLAARLEDEAELPVAMGFAGSVWQGTIDRLYRTQDGWILEDYKTDAHVRPEIYLGQLGLYMLAASETRKVEPRVRLVYLRQRKVVELGGNELHDVLQKLAGA